MNYGLWESAFELETNNEQFKKYRMGTLPCLQ